jgi:hypothetical protein
VTRIQTLPPSPEGVCPCCGVPHADDLPHVATSAYYQTRFLALHGRSPTWLDAVSHLSPLDQAVAEATIRQLGQWSRPETGQLAIADPPAECLREPVEVPVERQIEAARQQFEIQCLQARFGQSVPFTYSMLQAASRIDTVQQIKREVVEPNIQYINDITQQDNDPTYMAYWLQHCCQHWKVT